MMDQSTIEERVRACSNAELAELLRDVLAPNPESHQKTMREICLESARRLEGLPPAP